MSYVYEELKSVGFNIVPVEGWFKQSSPLLQLKVL